MPIKTCVFDAYGTLFDVNAAARTVAREPGSEAIARHWERLAGHWRDKQLQYTWLRSLRGDHADFWQVTTDALDWALEAEGLTDPALREKLLGLYKELPAYPEVRPMLQTLKSAGFNTAILSNGAPEMLDSAIASAEIGTLLDAVLSVESIGIYKPDKRVYAMVEDHFGCSRDAVYFVSANGWDAASASRFGFATGWVNRAGAPMERLPKAPIHVMADLSAVPELVRSL